MIKKAAKRLTLIALKIGLVVALLTYLSRSNKLDLSLLQKLIHDPEILICSILLWLVGNVFMTSLRWQRLVAGMGLKLSIFKAMLLNLVGFFFNIVSPGAVGGDLIKSVYVYRDQPHGRKTPALLSILLDRIIGLYGIFTIATVVAVFTNSFQHEQTFICTSSLFSLVFFLAMTAFFASIFIPFKAGKDPFLAFFSKKVIGFSLLKKIYEAISQFKERPWYLVQAWLLAVGFQLLLIAFFLLVTVKISGSSFLVQDFITVYPIGAISIALPVAPGGMGVGHLAFERIFYLIGVQDGANIFNIVFIAQNLLNLLGFIPYLFIHKLTKQSQT